MFFFFFFPNGQVRIGPGSVNLLGARTGVWRTHKSMIENKNNFEVGTKGNFNVELKNMTVINTT